MQDYEKLGAFYLGRLYDSPERRRLDDLLLYDSKDLTTHALIVGMTGSGKTGLGVSLLEEAAIDGIPTIAVDPKGDLGNLLLTFPDLTPQAFRPWVDEGEAARAGLTPEQYAARVAKTWKEGLADWDQPPERIGLYAQSVDRAIYTPGSDAGRPLTVLRSLDAPAPALREDGEAFRESIGATASALLALVGIDADPLQSREHILLANILDHYWRGGHSLALPDLIRAIQSPPIDRVGVFDLETFYPEKDRTGLAMRINNLLASPAFAGWVQGEPLSIKRLLHTPEGRPRLSIISIAHLGEAERMFFVTVLLNELLAWVRSQPGTSSLRALFYMDEIFGYFPPVANPPSKATMLTLLKQARAYGVGIVLATQNPADLDYKGLANTGTWFLGRLQTDRDKQRVLDGLEGATAQAGRSFDRGQLDAILSGLGKRVFLMNNVHEDAPVTFQTRWALSYLRGPLTREHLRRLSANRPAPASEPTADTPTPVAAPNPIIPSTPTATRPVVPSGVEELFLSAGDQPTDGEQLVYRPALLGQASLHFIRASYNVDLWRVAVLVVPVDGHVETDPWADGIPLPGGFASEKKPMAGASFAEVPTELLRESNYRTWKTKLKDRLYQTHTVTVWRCKDPKCYSEPDESEGDFRVRLAQAAHERRDLEMEKLRTRYASKLATIKERIESAERAIEREEGQYERATTSTLVSIGSSLLGALFGRKLASRTNVGRTATSARSAGRAADQRGDVKRAEAKLEDLKADLAALEKEVDDALQEVREKYDAATLELEALSVTPRKSDLDVERVALAWIPWATGEAGNARPLLRLERAR